MRVTTIAMEKLSLVRPVVLFAASTACHAAQKIHKQTFPRCLTGLPQHRPVITSINEGEAAHELNFSELKASTMTVSANKLLSRKNHLFNSSNCFTPP